ncbi:MAG: nitroreductase family protein [Clostridiales bacterium]|nr:nitroreductase family protein [Clostridiales bacterium]
MRKVENEILDLIEMRWSPRAFSDEKVALEEIYALIEAASLAPSCFNEQPWRFIVFYDDDQVEKLKGFLSDKNKLWNKSVRTYILILTKKHFDHDRKDNKWAEFDSGTAWGFLSLEAERRGLITHAMAGFARNAVIQHLDIHEDFTPIALIAVGKYGDVNLLDEIFKSSEKSSERLPYKKLIIEKKFTD